jgi:hypothetical protein
MTIGNLASLANRAPSASEVLARLGLERRRSRAHRAARCAGWLGLGMAVGSGLAMLFASRDGAQTRERLARRAKRARDYVAPSETAGESRDGGEAARRAGAHTTRRV